MGADFGATKGLLTFATCVTQVCPDSVVEMRVCARACGFVFVCACGRSQCANSDSQVSLFPLTSSRDKASKSGARIQRRRIDSARGNV